MISGSVDNNVMIWTSPFEGYQGEKLEGIDVTMQKEPKKREYEGIICQRATRCRTIWVQGQPKYEY